MNHLITLRYDGSAYHGWQRQENAVTVQQTLEQAVEKLFGEKVSVSGCSRTDTGVHANCFKCSFKTEKCIPDENIISGLNFFLPDDIAVFGSQTVPEDFNARFNCVSKEYIYKIYNGKYPNPFYQNRALHFKSEIDTDFLNGQAQDYLGFHDFSAFRSAGSTVLTTERTVLSAGVKRIDDLVVFSVEADGFLYNMVRIMVGTLLYISQGKITPDSIPDIIASKNRVNAGKTAEPYGLYLNKVNYREGFL